MSATAGTATVDAVALDGGWPAMPVDVIGGPGSEPGTASSSRRRAVAVLATAAAVLLLWVGAYQQGDAAGRTTAGRTARATAEAAYLALLRDAPVEDSMLPQGLTKLTDAQLLSFGRQACAAYRAGATVEDLARAHGDLTAPIPGKPGMVASPPNPMLPLVADTASRQLCPQYLADSDPGPPAQRWDPADGRDVAD